ncbi:MAG: response regulator [Deltaproteobacteria bacterium]|nr:response regulator [Deltaproteobacteria bacterium]
MPGKIKVLMVDDEEQFRITTSKILTRRGYDTTVAGSGNEAVEIVKTARQDVIVLDIKMPGMDGHDVLREIKKIDSRAQVIMLTGHGNLDSARESLSEGAYDYLAKPCDIDLLASKIRDAYGAAQEGVKEEKRAKDIMIPVEDYTTIGLDNTIREGIERLKQSYESFVATGKIMETGHRSIVVLDSEGEMAGILSILDLIEFLRPSYLSAPKPSTADSLEYSTMFWSGLFTVQAKVLMDKKIRDVMSDPPYSINEDTNLMEVADTMFREKSRRLSVSREGKVVGIVREQEIFFEIARIVLETPSGV